jgi:hypothetical protein
MRLRRVLMTMLSLAAMVTGFDAKPATAATGAIRGQAFDDLDRDGERDPDEPVIAGAQLYLSHGPGTYIGTTLTDAAGTYEFTGLAAATYVVDWADRASRVYEWVPTTTVGIAPSHAVTVDGDTSVADFGWRRIVWSSDLGAPVSTFTGPSGLRVDAFNDAVPARAVHDAVLAGHTDAEAAKVRVRFAFGSTSATVSSSQIVGGQHTNFLATITVSWSSWLDGDATLSHEYGHAWSEYHTRITQQDASFSGYLAARGLTGDPRVNASYAWSARELIAEDYRQLLGSPTARVRAQANTEIPPASQVSGLRDWFLDVFTRPPEATPTTTTMAPTATTTVVPTTTTTTPTKGGGRRGPR